MAWKDLVEELKKIEPAQAIADKIQSEYERIEAERYKAIGDTQSRGRQINELQKTLDTLIDSFGAEGETAQGKVEDLASKAKRMQSELKQAQTLVEELQTSKQKLEADLSLTSRRVAIRDAAIASKANPTVLETILSLEGNRELNIEIATLEDGSKQVLVAKGEEKKPIKDYATQYFTDFLPSLFPSESVVAESTPAPAPPKLPQGTPDSKAKAPVNYVNKYLDTAKFNVIR